uniref:Uncharacterized protein n=1 Tax=Fagus sylvatica TaxID=28930 RepID=A0A2N9HSV4_FAGSY
MVGLGIQLMAWVAVRTASPQKGTGTLEDKRRARTVSRMCRSFLSALPFCWERLRLTWCYERTTRVTEDARCVMWRDAMPVLQAARLASYGGYFCASESSKVRPFEWWWRCSDRRLVPKIPMKAMSLLAMYSTFDNSGHIGILTAAAEQYRRQLRQRKNARKNKDCTKHL